MFIAQSVGAVKYIGCFSAEGPGYGTKQIGNMVTVMLEFGRMHSTPFIAINPRLTLASDRVQSMGKKELNCVLILKCIV